MNHTMFRSYSNINQNATETGAIYGLDAIKQDIINTALTRKGSMAGDVKRGLLINDFVFSPSVNDYEKNNIINDAYTQYEEDPRFDILDISVFNDDETQTLIMYMRVYVKPFDQEVDLTIPFRG